MRSFCALVVALLIVGAYAQDNVYSHIAAGKFRRGGSVHVGPLARFDVAGGFWQGSATSKILGVSAGAADGFVPSSFSIRDLEVHPSAETVFLLSGDTASDRVVAYTPSTDSYLPLGEEFAAGEINDLVVAGDRLYICGTFTKTRPYDVNVSPRARTEVEKVGFRSLATANNLGLWSQIDPPTPTAAAQNVPDCTRLFRFGDRLIMVSGTQLFWRSAGTFEWLADPSNAAIGSNLRLNGGNAVSVGTHWWDGNTLYLGAPSGGLFTLNPATDGFQVVRSTDGLSWEGVTRINTVYLTNDPRAFNFVPNGPLFTHNGEVFYATSRANGTRTYFTISKNAPSASEVIPTRIGAAHTYVGVTNSLSSSASGSWLKYDGKLIVSTAADAVFYEEAQYAFSEGDPFLTAYRKSNRIPQVYGFDLATGAITPELGGGITTVAGAAVSATKLVRGSGASATSVWVIGGQALGWNKYFYGLAGYNEKKGWVALGDPVRDFLGWAGGGIDSAASGYATNRLDVGVTRVHAWQDGSNQFVIVAGSFRRINNATYNGIAWINTATPDTWNAMGSIGLHEATTNAVFPNPNGGGAVLTTTTYVRPGRVYAMSSTSGSGRNGRTLWIGGSFAGSGAVTLNNVAKYEFGDEASKTWVPLAGGVNGRVYAIDAIGKKVFVGGSFTRAGNMTARNIAMWDDDKKVWNTMQTGVAGTVRQIIANGENNVWVVSDATEAGGVITTSRIHVWNGQRWTFFDCSACTIECVKLNNRLGCGGNTVELRQLGGRLWRRSDDASISFFDGSQWRGLTQSAATIPYEGNSEPPRSLLVRGLTGDRIFLGNNGNNPNQWTPKTAQISTDIEDQNVYPVFPGGFDDELTQMNSGVSVAPLMAVLVALLAAFALFL